MAIWYIRHYTLILSGEASPIWIRSLDPNDIVGVISFIDLLIESIEFTESEQSDNYRIQL